MRDEGIVPVFRWLPKSILNQNDFYDHHFLYHIALIPFTFGDLRIGAKLSAIIFPALSFTIFYFLFRRQKIPYPWLWALGLLVVSEAFLFRMSITRAQSASLGFLGLGVLWLLEEKHWGLSILAFLYVWTYNAFPLFLVAGFFYVLACLILDRRFQWKSLVFIVIGIFAGLIINPYFPRNIIFTIRHIVPKLGRGEVSGLGNEWFPYYTSQLLENSLPSLIIFISGVFAMGMSSKKMDTRTLLALFLTILFAAMLFRSRRFIEYFPPFALIFAAFAWAPLIENIQLEHSQDSKRNRVNVRFWVTVTLSIALAGIFVYSTLNGTRQLMRTSKPYNLYQNAALWLKENTQEGALIFQSDWDDFPRLFFYNTHNTYLAGLDPTFFQQYDPDLFDLWVNLTRGRIDFPSDEILENFDAAYIFTDLNHEQFIQKAFEDPEIIEVFRDDQAVIFKIVENNNQ